MSSLRNSFFPTVVFLIAVVFLTAGGDEPKFLEYPSIIESLEQVYDGDTIQGVRVKVKTFDGAKQKPEELWPGLVYTGDKLEIVTNVRIAGIDTPERRPRRAGRTEASLANEKAAAAASRQALQTLLKAHDYEIYLSSPELGKFAGRIIAHVFVGEQRISVAEYLLKHKYAVRYDGGKRLSWAEYREEISGNHADHN